MSNRFRFRAGLVLLFALLAVLGAFANPYLLFVAGQAVLYCILIVGLNVLMGYAGLLAFAHAAMFGIGAYATGLLQVHLGWSFLPAAVCGAATAAVSGMLLAFPALRLKGLHLALATLSFALAVQWVFLNWTPVTFGASGFRAPALDIGLGLGREREIYFLVLAVALLVVLATDNVLRSRFGRRLVSIRDNEIAAACMGIDVTGTKVFAFGYSSLCAGIAGALYVPVLGFVAPESFDLPRMILMQVMVVVGGLGSVAGSLLGVGVMSVVFELLRDSLGYFEIVLGALLIGFVLLKPDGLVTFFQRWTGRSEPFMPRGLAAPAGAARAREQNHGPA